jgi:hypothetical protein
VGVEKVRDRDVLGCDYRCHRVFPLTSAKWQLP